MSLQLDIALDDMRWTDVQFEPLARAASVTTLTHLGIDPAACDISVLACDDARIAELNSQFRDKQGATNVLSWPDADLAADEDGLPPIPPQPDPDGTLSLGDIAIAYDTCQREAQAASITFTDHVTHLMVHGVLHLLGYDHIRDGDAVLMERLEVEILGTLGISDPYRVK